MTKIKRVYIRSDLERDVLIRMFPERNDDIFGVSQIIAMLAGIPISYDELLSPGIVRFVYYDDSHQDVRLEDL